MTNHGGRRNLPGKPRAAGPKSVRAARAVDWLSVVLFAAAAALLIWALFPAQIGGAAPAISTWVSGLSLSDPDRTATGNYLSDPGFDQPASSSAGDGESGPAHISGMLAQGWSDISGWGAATLHYAIDPHGSRSGKACQQVVIGHLGQGGAQMSIAQSHYLPWGRYHGEVWLRSTGRVPVLVTLQNQSGQAAFVKVLTTPQWRKVEFDCWLPSSGDAQFQIDGLRPGVLWIDDAELRRTSDGVVTWIEAALIAAIILPIYIIAMRRVLRGASEGSTTVRVRGNFGYGPDLPQSEPDHPKRPEGS